MCQMFPHHGHLVEGLRVSLALSNGRAWYRERTSFAFCESPSGYTLIRFTRTLEPPRDPSCTYPEAGGGPMSRAPESVHDFGSTSLLPHIFLSSWSDSWKATLAELEIPTRTYAGAERRMERYDLETHAIQVLNKPHQIPPLQSRNSISILVPVKEASEVLVKVWRGSVEVVESLDGIGLGHDHAWLG